MLDRAAGYLDKRLVLTVLSPTLVFWGAMLWLVISNVGWQASLDWWRSLAGELRTLLVLSVVAGVLLFASLLSVQLGPLTRFFEGYWHGPSRWFTRVGVRLQGRRYRRLDPGNPRDYEIRFRMYPRREADLLPTRLGNVLRSAELYPGDKGRYGIDAVFFWPRLFCVLPDAMRTSLQDARASLDLLLVTSALASAYALVAGCWLTIARVSWSTWVATVGATVVVALLTYRGAVRAAIIFGDLVRTAFDLYREALLQQLGYALPASLDAERRLWLNLGQQLYRRAASDPDVLDLARTVRPLAAAGPLQDGPLALSRPPVSGEQPPSHG